MKLSEFKTKYISQLYFHAESQREKEIVDNLVTKIYNLNESNTYDLAFTLYLALKEDINDQLRDVLERMLEDLQDIEF
jgi:hypothetical protein